jgi:hypothetical protein
MFRRFLPVLILLVLLPAASAQAARTEIGIADDRILVAGGPTADRAVREWKRLGVDTVRIFALWSRLAPFPDARRKPEGFDAADPNSPAYAWSWLDAAVTRVREAGMDVTLSVTGPGPLWSSGSPRRGRATHRPKPREYAAFAEAVARRYGHVVDRYLLWNEPNLRTWLRPQAECKRKGGRQRCKLIAPHLYRGLVRAAYPRVREGDPGADVVIGSLAPRGSSVRRDLSIRPLEFLRAMGCRTASFRRMRSGACRRFRPASGDGLAIHPYALLAPPDKPLNHPDDVNLGELDDVTRTVDRLRRAGGLRSSGRMGIYVDEFGYQTNPPDRFGGVRPRVQDSWLQRAAYIGWRNPRLRLLTQYVWMDEPRVRGRRATSGFQSGLRFANGRAKPSLRHFDTPFVLDAARNRLWGQMRPGGAHRVTIERRLRRGAPWRRFATVRTDSRGYFTVRRRLSRGASYRFRAGKVTSAARTR